ASAGVSRWQDCCLPLPPPLPAAIPSLTRGGLIAPAAANGGTASTYCGVPPVYPQEPKDARRSHDGPPLPTLAPGQRAGPPPPPSHTSPHPPPPHSPTHPPRDSPQSNLLRDPPRLAPPNLTRP